MKARFIASLQWIERRVVERRDSVSSLFFVELTLATLLPLLLFQWDAAYDASAQGLFRDSWMRPALWAQAALVLWLMAVGVLAWRQRQNEQVMPCLVQAAVLPSILGVGLLCLAYGIKDTPMGVVLLAEVVLARALFSLRQLRWAFILTLVAVLLAEWGQAKGWLAYAPMLSHPVYLGHELHPWWAIWVRVVFFWAAGLFSGCLFLLAFLLNRQRAMLETLVSTDMLTGLANRREFMTRLARESHRQARSERPLSVVMFDVDNFKRINDTWGHPVGDNVLAQIGGILRAHTRDQVDTAARYGGEEFVLLLPETDLLGAQHVAEKVSARLREYPFAAAGQAFKVTQSVGIAQVVDGDTDWALKVADQNLYQAKRDGRDRIVASKAFAVPPPL
ncbi:MAG: GGDEF domain-containing protein [Aquabacterium sp.]|nr:GGDEF domain-containing protein [Aquabacterium sp.]